MQPSAENAVQLQGQQIFFDPDKKLREGIACISHAHKDHLANHEVPVIASEHTKKLAGINNGKQKPSANIQMFNSGHILGSTSFKINELLYTGDMSLDNKFFETEVPKCETLVIESTFGLPSFRFPSRQKVEKELKQWIRANFEAGRNILIGGYSLGKAQEITKTVNEAGFTPFVGSDIAEVNQVYEKAGIDLGDWTQELGDRFVAVMPMHSLSPQVKKGLEAQTGRQVSAAVCTGWATKYSFSRKGADRAFPLSGHADFKDLLAYVKKTEANKVYTNHGYAKEFANALRERGFDAKPLTEIN